MKQHRKTPPNVVRTHSASSTRKLPISSRVSSLKRSGSCGLRERHVSCSKRTTSSAEGVDIDCRSAPMLTGQRDIPRIRAVRGQRDGAFCPCPDSVDNRIDDGHSALQRIRLLLSCSVLARAGPGPGQGMPGEARGSRLADSSPAWLSPTPVLEPFILQPPTGLGITPVEFPYRARAEATNFKFTKMASLSSSIGLYWQQLQPLARSCAIALCPLVPVGVR
jgi:hypothetical protein